MHRVVLAASLGILILCRMISTAHAASEPSAVLFAQMAKVLQHPRCMNCHPRADFPRQGDDSHPHTFGVSRGPADHGAAGLHCNACHQSVNQSSSGVPGAADWQLAPLRMAWDGMSVGQLCRALGDPRAGAMQPQALIAHFKTSLVRWAWAPGVDSRGKARSVPPIDYAAFMSLTQRWIDSGAECPA